MGLLRAASLDDMQEIMGVESPAGRFARLLLEPIWEDLRRAGLPLLPATDLRKIDKSVFTKGESIIEQAGFDFTANAESGAVLAAHIDITTTGDIISEAVLQEITVNGQPWREGTLKVLPNKPAPQFPSNIEERLDALREVIGG